MKSISIKLLLAAFLISMSACAQKTDKKEGNSKLKVLIIDGENNHYIWPKTTMMMKDYLKQTGLFEVAVARKNFTWKGEDLIEKFPLEKPENTEAVKEPKFDPNFSPDFSKYNVVISNLGWKASELPEQTRKNLEDYMKNGGGLVVVHAADNSWGDWLEFNKMIGIGGWGGRNTESGPYLYYDQNDTFHRDPSEGPGGTHGAQREFIIKTRNSEHPIMKGLPTEWLHTKDELYEYLRGPAENVTVLATALSEKENPEKARNEPMLMVIDYGKGRTFHTTLGHMDYSMECVGFITTLQRGAEWAATGKVTQEIPEDFPSKKATSSRKWEK